MNRDFSIEPKTAEEKAECETIAGMRQRIQRYRRENSLTRTVMDAAYYQGLSGEDTMTWLAFEALRRIEAMEKLILNHHLTHAAPPLIAPVRQQP